MENDKNFKKSYLNSSIKFGLLNIRSILNKFDQIYDLLFNDLDVFALVETWHRSSDDISVLKSLPPGFSYFDFLRPNDPGHGGIILFFRSEFYCKRIPLPTLLYFEALAVKLIVNSIDFVLLIIYRPGSVQITKQFF